MENLLSQLLQVLWWVLTITYTKVVSSLITEEDFRPVLLDCPPLADPGPGHPSLSGVNTGGRFLAGYSGSHTGSTDPERGQYDRYYAL